MADTRISNLASGGAVAANDRFVAVETPGVGPVIKTGSQLKTWAASTVSDPLNLAQYNGATDCTTQLQAALDYCFGTSTAPHGTSANLNKPFILPPGQFNISSPLVLTKVRGGLLSGAGRFTTSITNVAGGSVFVTNGFEYSRVQGMRIAGSGASTELFTLDWDGSSGPALQSNTFSDIYFEGAAYGVTIGKTGNMGSENLFLNCFFSGNTESGLKTLNFNALQNTVIGGNFQNCGWAIHVAAGSVPIVMGVGFQGNDQDIVVQGAVFDTYLISGCRTESANFFRNVQNTVNCVVQGCNQLSSTAGLFIQTYGNICLDGCYSQNGQLSGVPNSKWNLRVNRFGRSDFFISDIGSMIIDGEPITTLHDHSVDYDSSFTLDDSFAYPSIIEPNSASGVTITIPPNSSVAIPVGTSLQVCQAGAGQITIAAGSGVTLRTARSLTTRAQYSTITIRKRGVNEWILSGDLT